MVHVPAQAAEQYHTLKNLAGVWRYINARVSWFQSYEDRNITTQTHTTFSNAAYLDSNTSKDGL